MNVFFSIGVVVYSLMIIRFEMIIINDIAKRTNLLSSMEYGVQSPFACPPEILTDFELRMKSVQNHGIDRSCILPPLDHAAPGRGFGTAPLAVCLLIESEKYVSLGGQLFECS